MGKLFRLLKEQGLGHTLRWMIHLLNVEVRMLADRKFDRKFGVNTSGIIRLYQYRDINADQKETGIHYEPTPVPALNLMLKALAIDHSKYTFVDFGSGKGRVLLLASEYPYREIIGVEFSQTLHNIAENNIKAWKNPKQKCFTLKSICMDARDFKLPNDPLILFFFTPFKPNVITKVVANIQESLKDNPRAVQILFYGTNQDFIDTLGKLNFARKEIYSLRPFTAMKRYKGLHFSSL